MRHSHEHRLSAPKYHRVYQCILATEQFFEGRDGDGRELRALGMILILKLNTTWTLTRYWDIAGSSERIACFTLSR